MRHGIDPRALIDDLLELTVVGSFSRVGPTVRRRLFAWTPPSADALAGRTVLVTGPTSGLGRQVTDDLATAGARVILVGRSAERLTAVRSALVARHGEDRFPIVVADMGSLASVRAAAVEILATESRLDVLIDNAGAIFPERTIGPDGIEATFGTLVVGPFALIGSLLPVLARTPGSRVIAVTSGGQYAQAIDVDDLERRRRPLRRDARLRPGQARPGHPHPRVGASSRPGRDPVRFDASGVGRYARPVEGAARLRQADGTAAPEPTRGHGHADLAGDRAGRPRAGWFALARPPAAPVRPAAHDPADVVRSPSAVAPGGRAVRPA